MVEQTRFKKGDEIRIKWEGGPVCVITGNLAGKLMARAEQLGVDVETYITARLKAEVTFNKVIEKKRRELKDADRQGK